MKIVGGDSGRAAQHLHSDYQPAPKKIDRWIQLDWLHSALLLWERPAWSAILAFLSYAALSLRRGPFWEVSDYPYYNYLADAFLHGQLQLRLLPVSTHDLVSFHGQYYLYWPPLPAVLLIPLVALFGAGISDILFTLLLGAANVALVALLLRAANREGLALLSPSQRALMVLFFALGTVHLTLAPYGRVWYTGQIVGFACLLLAYLAALQLTGAKAFFLTGLALAGALLTRNHLLLAGLWPVYWLLRKHRILEGIVRRVSYPPSSMAGKKPALPKMASAETPEGELNLSYGPAEAFTLAKKAVLLQKAVLLFASLAPILAALALLTAYNTARFGSPLEVGLDYHQMDPTFAAEYAQYGPFHTHYLAKNLYYQYLRYPFPLTREAYQGGSLFLLSPVFFAAFASFLRREAIVSNLVLLGTILLVSIPILLLMGTGWIQFGPRYTLDFTVPLLLLTAQGARRIPVPILALLTLVSIVHYVLGTNFLLQVM